MGEKKKIETSKIIVLASFVIVTAVTLFSCALMWKTGDTSPLQVIIPTWGVAITAAVTSYFNKAKAENIIKLQKALDAAEEKPKGRKAQAKDPALLKDAIQQAIAGYFDET